MHLTKYTNNVIFFKCLAGEAAVFSCATDMAHAGLTASWLKDNKPIGDNMADRAKITAKENVFTLTIDKVQSGDSGQYTCRVTNANNETCTCSAQLEVHQRKSMTSVQILLLLVTTNLATMICTSIRTIPVHVPRVTELF